MKKGKFETLCETIAERYDLPDVLFCRDEPYQPPFEDDGYLHVVQRGIRAVFGVSEGQTLTGQQQNRVVRAIMEDLGLEVTERVLVEEEEDGEE